MIVLMTPTQAAASTRQAMQALLGVMMMCSCVTCGAILAGANPAISAAKLFGPPLSPLAAAFRYPSAAMSISAKQAAAMPLPADKSLIQEWNSACRLIGDSTLLRAAHQRIQQI